MTNQQSMREVLQRALDAQTPQDFKDGYVRIPVGYVKELIALLSPPAILGEVVEALEPFARMGDLVTSYDEFRGVPTTSEWAEHFRRASRVLSSIRDAK